MNIVFLDGRRMTSVEEAHKYMAEAMGFPDWYGGNLDALADCLSELGGGTCVVLTKEAAMRAALGGYADRLMRVFEDASAGVNAFYWVVE